ncbi:PspC domain-containing protein [Nocardioides sp. SYSU D00065]|uniref:PspC domain-containing protein n=1 Tax=Nocardioides sp. SYSU D00065 TaxID=2817378 RepID=UPI001B3394E7|nr:PspC domain-containing protein [Nocardioides sp. SYSU D00065]
MDRIRSAFARQGLVRSQERGILGGVCAGVGRRLGLGPWMTRLLFAVTLVAVPGSQLLVYPLLWWLMPSEEHVAVSSAGGAYPLR